MFQKDDDPVRLAVDLVNTWDLLEEDPELLRDAASLRRFLSRRGYGEAPRRPSGRDLADVRELNGVLRRSAAKPQFELAGEEWRVEWVGRLPDSIASVTAMSLLEAIRDDGWERFGICAGAPCCCVFVDRSKNRSRRFCSDLCADRVAQALHRERRRARR